MLNAVLLIHMCIWLFPAPFVEEAAFSLMCNLGLYVKNQVLVVAWGYTWDMCLIQFNYIWFDLIDLHLFCVEVSCAINVFSVAQLGIRQDNASYLQQYSSSNAVFVLWKFHIVYFDHLCVKSSPELTSLRSAPTFLLPTTSCLLSFFLF